MAQYAHDPALGVGFDLFKADLAVQFIFIKAFDAGLANGLRAPVLGGIQLFGFFFVDTPHITDRMGKVIALGVMAHELCLDIDTRQAELIHGQQGNLIFRQLVQQGRGIKRVARLLHGLGKYRTVFVRQVQDAHHQVQHFGGIPGPFAGNGHIEAGLVIGQQHAIAVVDKTALRGDGQHVYPVVLGDRRVVVKLGDLQKIHTADQRATDGQHQPRARDQSFIDQAFFAFVIFKRDRFGHVVCLA